MFKLMNAKKNRKGFTLIELIVVIAILGILAAVLLPKFAGFTDKAKNTQALIDAKQFATAYDSLVAEGKTWAAAVAPGSFTTADVMDLAKLVAADGAASGVDAAGAFTWTASAAKGGKTAGRDAGGPVVAPAP